MHLHKTMQDAGKSCLGCMCAVQQATNSHRALRLLAADAQHPQGSPGGCVAGGGRWGGERHASEIVHSRGPRHVAVARAGSARKAGAAACSVGLQV